MSNTSVRYLVFDIESVADGALVSKLQYPGEQLEPRDAIARFRAELLEKKGSDFIPYTFQLPVSVAIAKVTSDFELIDLVVLDEPEYRPHEITKIFWRGWEAYRGPTLVTFNGRGFDVPLMELAAFRYGVSVPQWFDDTVRTYEQRRNRYNTKSHLDLHDLMTNFGASRFNGGLNLAANLLGKPGKMDVQGDMVQDMYDEGRLGEINDYCRCDVLDTYFVFLRTRTLVGDISLEREHDLIVGAKEFITQRADDVSAYRNYLQRWGDWRSPWGEQAVGV